MNTIKLSKSQARRLGETRARARLEGKADPDDLGQGVLDIMNRLSRPHGDGYYWTERGEDLLIAYLDGVLEVAQEIVDQASTSTKLRSVK